MKKYDKYNDDEFLHYLDFEIKDEKQRELLKKQYEAYRKLIEQKGFKEIADIQKNFLVSTATNKTMAIDYYEFTMSKTYFDNKEKDKEVYFDVFFRKNPFKSGYTIMGGLDEIINYIKNFRFTLADIQFLRNQKCFSEEFLAELKDLKFTGDIYAVPDGTPIFPNEPVITVKARTIEAQLVETAILACFNHGSLVMTAAKRIAKSADGRPVMEFGARRARGIDSACEVSKYAYIAGCSGTSNTKTAMDNNIPALGTMAHSLVCDSAKEYDAFLNYAKSNPNNCIFLVDSYDTLKIGIPNAIRVARDYLIPNGYKFKGIRIDSGDLAYLSKEARRMLDEAGFTDTKICLSNGLDEDTIASLNEQGAKYDSLGVGDNISAAKERLGGVYKLVAVNDDGIKPRIKVSNDTIKTINPGYKKVYRLYDKKTGYAIGDVIALYDENLPNDKYVLINPKDEWQTKEVTDYVIRELQVPIFERGELVYSDPSIEEKKEYCEREYGTLYPEVTRRKNPHEYYVDLTRKLLNLKKQLIEYVKSSNQLENGDILTLEKKDSQKKE